MSFQGRVCGNGASGALSADLGLHQAARVVFSRRHGSIRGRRSLQCNALALSSFTELPWVRVLLRTLHIHQAEQQVSSEYVSSSTVTGSQKWKVGAAIKDATLTAVHLGLSLTGAAINLASKVVSDWQQRAKDAREKQEADKKQAAARQTLMDAQTQLKYEIQRKRLELQGKDKAFVSMLHVLDRCHLDHDVKWALVQKHTADKAEFSERLQQLYNLAEASKDAVDTLLRPDASRKEINTFWKSPETVAIIAEEDKLKSLVFAQMLQAST